MGTTQEITKAAKALASAEKRLAKLQTNELAAVKKATEKATKKYAEKVSAAAAEVLAARKTLQDVVAAA